MKQGYIKQFAAVLGFLAVVGLTNAVQAGVSGPVVDFEGRDCTQDCFGDGAFATIFFNEGFEFGVEFGAEEIDSFSFSSNSGVFNGFQLSFIQSAEGLLNGGPNEQANVTIFGVAFVEDAVIIDSEELFTGQIGFEFNSFVDEGWNMIRSTFIPEDDSVFFNQTDDIGRLGVFNPTAVPEPGTLALFGIGILGLGIAARRRRAA